MMAGVAALACFAAANAADTVSTSFGSLPSATFGGSGIPNDAVAITTFGLPEGSLTLGLSATARYSNPAVTNDGAGTFFALAGGDTLDGAPAYGVWNFDFYSAASFTPGSGYTLTLLYDVDPAAGSSTGSLQLPIGYQDSWNLGMGFLGGGFDPNANGEYSFALVLARDGTEVGRSSMNVIVGSGPSSVPDVSSTLALSLAGLAGVGLVRRKSRRTR